MRRYPHPANGGCTLSWPGQNGVPPQRDWMGAPLQDRMGYSPQNSTASTCYEAGGMPLAFPQEEFLVHSIFSCLIDWFFFNHSFRFINKVTPSYISFSFIVQRSNLYYIRMKLKPLIVCRFRCFLLCRFNPFTKMKRKVKDCLLWY